MSIADYQDPFNMSDLILDRPRRCKLDNNRLFGGVDPCRKSLALEGVVDVLKCYDEYGGGINCSVCGKLYKSRVCFTKHLWEHSIYWDLFDDLAKNQDRVLSIQAALILCGGWQNDKFQDLLVTTPQHHQSSKSTTTTTTTSTTTATTTNGSAQTTAAKVSPLRTKKACKKRKRYNSGGSESVTSSGSETPLSETGSDIENRYEFDNVSSDESLVHDGWPSARPALLEPPSIIASLSQSDNCQTSSGSVKRRRLSGLPPKKRWMAASLADHSRPN